MYRNKALLEHTLMVQRATNQVEELEKRIKFCPFDRKDFDYALVYESGPHFFVVRDMMRRLGLDYSVAVSHVNPSNSLVRGCLIITPWSQYTESGDVRVRGELLEACKMPLYCEAGEWDVPQCNPVFDWTEMQAWAYLIDRGIFDPEL